MMHIHTTSPAAWQTLLEDCRSATRFIYLEQFIFKDFGEGEIGREFFDLFKQKAQDGVEVKLILDSVGSIGFYANPWRQNELIAAGVQIRFFNIVPRWRASFPFNIIHRDHRKILVVDDMYAHVGGVGIWEASRDWHDLHVRMQNPEYVREIKGAFFKMWDELSGISEYKKEYEAEPLHILKTNPENNNLYKEIRKRVKAAKERITIVTPYFSPDYFMLRALKKACKRGVKVDIVLPEKCDNTMSAMVGTSYVWELQRKKISMHFYSDCMNHGKAVVIDDWVTLGSMNFDRLSFFYNRELNIVLTEDIQHAVDVIEDIKQRSKKVGKDYFKVMSFAERCKTIVGRLLRPFV